MSTQTAPLCQSDLPSSKTSVSRARAFSLQHPIDQLKSHCYAYSGLMAEPS